MFNYIDLLAEDNQLITFRPQINRYYQNIYATVLLQQIIFLYKLKGNKPFYKFKEPCDHSLYKNGDSWCEVLTFNPYQFDKAIKRIAQKVNCETKDIEHNYPVQYWVDSGRVTHYTIVEKNLNNILNEIYVNSKVEFTKTSPSNLDNTERTTEITSYNNIIDINCPTDNNPPSGEGKGFVPFVDVDSNNINKHLTVGNTNKDLKIDNNNKHLTVGNNKDLNEYKEHNNPYDISYESETKKSYKTNNKPLPVVKPEVQRIIDYWNESGLTRHIKPEAKVYQNMIYAIEQLLQGIYFNNIEVLSDDYSNRVFTEEDIYRAIDNFYQAATNINFEPKSTRSKQYLRKMGFPVFVFNDRAIATTPLDYSQFLKYVDNDPAKIAFSTKVRNTAPEHTNAIKHFYVKEILGGLEPKEWSKYDESCFIECGKMIKDFFVLNIDKLTSRHYASTPFEQARLTWEALKNKYSYNISTITPGYFNKQNLFDYLLPAYLNDQGVIKQR